MLLLNLHMALALHVAVLTALMLGWCAAVLAPKVIRPTSRRRLATRLDAAAENARHRERKVHFEAMAALARRLTAASRESGFSSPIQS